MDGDDTLDGGPAGTEADLLDGGPGNDQAHVKQGDQADFIEVQF